MEADGKEADGVRGRGIRIRVLNPVIVTVAVLLTCCVLWTAQETDDVANELRDSTEEYIACELAANDLLTASNYMGTQARMFVLTRDTHYLARYFIEENETQRRERALETLDAYIEDEVAKRYLDQAYYQSNLVVERERYALRLAADAGNITPGGASAELLEVDLSYEDARLDDETKLGRAELLLFDEYYQKMKDEVEASVDLCNQALLADIGARQDASSEFLRQLLLRQQFFTVALLGVGLLALGMVVAFVLRPLGRYAPHIANDEPLPVRGAEELRYVARAYNEMYEGTKRYQDHLLHEAEHDGLTDLLNRSAYDRLYDEAAEHRALLLIDVDLFKDVNDDYGHDVGDRVLKKVAAVLKGAFRTTDFPCRIGGDEFAVVMTDMRPELRHVVEEKVAHMKAQLASIDDDLPDVRLSVGVAFSEDADDSVTLYKAADLALYHVKQTGRDGCAFYSDLQPAAV